MKICYLVSLLLLSINTFAQNGPSRGTINVDHITLLALGEDFPGASEVNWSVIEQGYEAEFFHQGYKMRVQYTIDGILLFREFVVPEKKYPSLRPIWEHLAETYPGYGLRGLYLCDIISEKYYCARIRYRGKEFELRYDTRYQPIED